MLLLFPNGYCRQQPTLVSLLCWLFFLMHMSSSHAALNRLNLNAGISLFTDDNYSQRISNENQVDGSQQRVRLAFDRDTETLKLGSSLFVNDVYLSDSDAKEADYYKLDFDLGKQLERRAFDLGLSWINDTALSDEVLFRVPQSRDVTRNRYRLNFGYKESFSEVFDLQTSVSMEKLDFSRLDLDLSEYNAYTVSLQPVWSYSEVAAFYAQIYANQVDYQDISASQLIAANRGFANFISEANTQGLSFGWQNQFQSRLTADVRVGFRKTDYTQQPYVFFSRQPEQQVEGDGLTFQAYLRYQGERSSVSASASQEVTSNSVGYAVDQKSFEIEGRYFLTEFVSVNGDLRWLQQRSDISSQRRDDLDSLIFRVGLEKRITPNFIINGNYRFLERKYISSKRDLSASRLSLGVTWYMDEYRW